VRDLHAIRTPENVVFEFERAGVASRALAWSVDLAVMMSAMTAVSCLVSAFQPVAGGFALALLSIAVFLVQWWYGALAEWWSGGRTIGKRVVGLRTLDARGLRITFAQAVVRNLVRVVDLLPALYLVGGACALLDPAGRRLGDLAAGTVVVRERRAPEPSRLVPSTERAHAFLRDPRVAYAARRVAPLEREAMVALSLRREALPERVRHALFARLATHLAARLGVARPPHLSEEKYVLLLTTLVLTAPAPTPVSAS